ncbi:sensor histidine kinase [Sphingobacterium chuzhouense]|uniref:histidine kinase n=1 Tax=Sphingobacterium chuzhouense TaxID=1742264 RepID=A0ABR7XUJ0_9SPHI|nr:HAMP domain-containing sensor histidine kinase [Sphingobacterium chuzhouense]MBD1422708.1 HAMP domain-containing histidine kinase [Sphingobacterium chuzhouense]
MKHRLRLLFIPLMASGAGIVWLLSSWLYGSYNQYIENTASTAERQLFDAIQEYVQAAYHEDKQIINKPTFLFEKALHEELIKTYPNVSADSLSEIMERIKDKILPSEIQHDKQQNRSMHFPPESRRTAFPKGDMRMPPRPHQLLPGFLFSHVNFDSTSYNILYDRLRGLLNENDLKINFELAILSAKDGKFITKDGRIILPAAVRTPVRSLSGTILTTRPLLIDAQQHQFITLTLTLPWRQAIYSLSWQLSLAVILVLTILGCFVYLFRTIFKQDKLAELRKAFVNQMTHELRTPVSTVYAAVQALQNFTEKEDIEKRAMFQSIAREELEHLSDMIDNVLQVAEDDHTTRKQLHYEHIHIEQLISKCITRVSVGSSMQDIQFDYENFVTGLLYADKLHLGNVITNLFDNAIKYGAKIIKVTTQDVRGGEFIAITVSDDGIGIPDTYHELIFDPFFRVPRDDNQRGFGLGLAYVKQIVRQHKGTIKLKSKKNSGTTFIIKIPKNYHL